MKQACNVGYRLIALMLRMLARSALQGG